MQTRRLKATMLLFKPFKPYETSCDEAAALFEELAHEIPKAMDTLNRARYENVLPEDETEHNCDTKSLIANMGMMKRRLIEVVEFMDSPKCRGV